MSAYKRRGAATFIGAPCKRCGNQERYLSGHCAICGKSKVREEAEDQLGACPIEHSEWTAMDDKLEAAGRCPKCHLLNPHECVSARVADYLGRRGEPSFSSDSGRR